MPRRCARAASLRPSTPIRGRRGYSDHVSEADPADGAASMRSPFLTPRWSKADSNSESHPRATPPAATRFIADSALEGAGFEPSVPRDTTEVSRGGLCRLARDSSPTANEPTGSDENRHSRQHQVPSAGPMFGSGSLHRRIGCELDFLDQGWRRRARIPTRMCGFAA
jgi:hypothetical protein